MIVYKVEIETYRDLDNLLWAGARDRWLTATDEQKEIIWDLLEIYCSDGDNPFELLTDINDFIWLDCDEIFYDE